MKGEELMEKDEKNNEECQHEYKEIDEPWNYESEKYVCVKCGHSYRIYYDEIR